MLGWERLSARATSSSERSACRCCVDNDVNTLAVSERLYGRGRDVENFLTVTIGRGVGLGIVAGGDIYRGFGGGAGEFGHVSAVDDGPALHVRQARLPRSRRRRSGARRRSARAG